LATDTTRFFPIAIGLLIGFLEVGCDGSSSIGFLFTLSLVDEGFFN
jgi:hypothetical protein